MMYWLQIGLHAISASRSPKAALLKVYAIEQRRFEEQSYNHSAALDVSDDEGVRDTPEAMQSDDERNPLNAWELRRAYAMSIPSLSLRAPVLLPSRIYWDARNWALLEEQMQAGMIQGTVAYPHSSRPGAGGALFIAGHSSPPSEEARRSAYGNVFAALPHMKLGDEIIITDGDERYIFIVTDTFVVNAEDTGILDSTHADGSLTLITCYPVGTTRQRFVVKAEKRTH
jgi:LPXTG-site transpeptidase (sortase) family protein